MLLVGNFVDFILLTSTCVVPVLQELKQANRELNKLKNRIPVQSRVMLGISTPERQSSLERKGTPGSRQGQGTPTATNHTPSRFEKKSSLNDRNTNHKENVKPDL